MPPCLSPRGKKKEKLGPTESGGWRQFLNKPRLSLDREAGRPSGPPNRRPLGTWGCATWRAEHLDRSVNQKNAAASRGPRLPRRPKRATRQELVCGGVIREQQPRKKIPLICQLHGRGNDVQSYAGPNRGDLPRQAKANKL